MRKALLLVALIALAATWLATIHAIYGPHPLPARFATHFDAAGNANGWGEPRMLWLFPIISTFIVAVMILVSRFPQAFNYPVRVTPAMRPRLEAISLSMIAWLRAELACLFLGIQYLIIRSAREGQNSLSPWLLPLAILVVFATILGHFVAMIRIGRTSARNHP